jgi:hypothetical protein
LLEEDYQATRYRGDPQSTSFSILQGDCQPLPFFYLSAPTFKFFALTSEELIGRFGKARRQEMITEARENNPGNFERRKYPRFSIDWPAEYWPVNIPKGRPGRTGDISEGGVLLYLHEKITVGQNVGVRIFIGPGFESKSIQALGQPVWNDSHFGKKDFYHRIGLKFVTISPENLGELKNVLNAQMKLESPSVLDIPPGLPRTLAWSAMNKEDELPVTESPIQRETWDLTWEPKDAAFSDTADGQEGYATQLPRELTQELQETYTDEQRQNLRETILDMSIPERFRLAIFANREARSLLIRDPSKMIAMNVLRNIKITEGEVVGYAQRKDLSRDVIVAIGQDPKWKKSYPIRFAIICNPKTPLSVAINSLPHLHEKDLVSLWREKNVSSVLRRRAQEILLKKNK